MMCSHIAGCAVEDAVLAWRFTGPWIAPALPVPGVLCREGSLRTVRIACGDAELAWISDHAEGK
jgi:hypothetical protein